MKKILLSVLFTLLWIGLVPGQTDLVIENFEGTKSLADKGRIGWATAITTFEVVDNPIKDGNSSSKVLLFNREGGDNSYYAAIMFDTVMKFSKDYRYLVAKIWKPLSSAITLRMEPKSGQAALQIQTSNFFKNGWSYVYFDLTKVAVQDTLLATWGFLMDQSWSWFRPAGETTPEYLDDIYLTNDVSAFAFPSGRAGKVFDFEGDQAGTTAGTWAMGNLAKFKVVNNPHKVTGNESDKVGYIVKGDTGSWYGSVLFRPVPPVKFGGTKFYLHASVWSPLESTPWMKVQDAVYGADHDYWAAKKTKPNEWSHIWFEISSDHYGAYTTMLFTPDGADRKLTDNDTLIFYVDNMFVSTDTLGNMPAAFELPITFEDPGIIGATSINNGGVIGVNIGANPKKDALNGSNNCLAFTRGKDGSPMAGVYFDLDKPLVVSNNNKFLHVQVYKNRTSDMYLQLENSKNGAIFKLLLNKYIHEGKDGWHDVVFDMSKRPNDEYKKIVLYLDVKDTVNLNANLPIYIDNIVLNNEPASSTSTTLAKQVAAQTVLPFRFEDGKELNWEVISNGDDLFATKALTIVNNPSKLLPNTSDKVAVFTKYKDVQGDSMINAPSGGISIGLTTPMEVTDAYRYLHVKILKPNNMKVGIRIEGTGDTLEMKASYNIPNSWSDVIFDLRGGSNPISLGQYSSIYLRPALNVSDAGVRIPVTESFKVYFDDVILSNSSETINTAIASVLVNNQVTLYPVPVGELLTVETINPMDQVEVYSITGSSILKKSVLGQLSTSLEMTNVQSGLYLVSVTFTDGTRTIQKVSKK